jgi:hypothetical protein
VVPGTGDNDRGKESPRARIHRSCMPDRRRRASRARKSSTRVGERDDVGRDRIGGAAIRLELHCFPPYLGNLCRRGALSLLLKHRCEAVGRAGAPQPEVFQPGWYRRSADTVRRHHFQGRIEPWSSVPSCAPVESTIRSTGTHVASRCESPRIIRRPCLLRPCSMKPTPPWNRSRTGSGMHPCGARTTGSGRGLRRLHHSRITLLIGRLLKVNDVPK